MNVKYTGEHPCSTRTPDLDWEPGETKNVDPEFAEYLLTNSLFQQVEEGAN